jgi:hypothetical protein
MSSRSKYGFTLTRGDFVRLKYGYTRMVVLGNRSGFLKAVYTSPTLRPIETYDKYGTLADFRPEGDYVPWDGGTASTMPQRTKRWYKQNNPQQLTEKNEMSKSYKVKMTSRLREYAGLIGQHLIDTQLGDVVLQFGDGQVRNFSTLDVTRVIPHVFRAQALKNSYTCYYDDPSQLASCDDLVVSDSGNLYRIIWVGQYDGYTKGEFQGSRLITQPFA